MAIASFFTELRDLAQHIESDCHSLKQQILHPKNAAGNEDHHDTGPSVEETLADLQAEVGQVDDELAYLVANQQGGSATQTLVTALQTMVQTHHGALGEAEEKLAGFGFVPESPLPTLGDLLQSCKEPSDEEQQDNTFCIDSDTSSDLTLNSSSINNHNRETSSSVAGVTKDIDLIPSATDSLDGVHATAAHSDVNPHTPMHREKDGSCLQSGGETSNVNMHSSPPKQQTVPEPPLESPSPPILGRDKIKLSATTMEALKRGEDLSPTGIPSTLSPCHMAKYRQGLGDDLSPVPLTSSLPRGIPGDRSGCGGDDTGAISDLHNNGGKAAYVEGQLNDDNNDNCNGDSSVPQHDFSLNFAMDTDFATRAPQPHSKEQETSQPAGSAMNFSTISSPGMTRDSALRAKYGRPSSYSASPTAQQEDTNGATTTSTSANATGEPEPAAEQLQDRDTEEVAVWAEAEPTDNDDQQPQQENQQGRRVEVSRKTEEEQEDPQEIEPQGAVTTTTVGDSHGDTPFTGNESLAAHVYEILRDLKPDEYSVLPSFVQAQVVLEDLNEVILALRECLKNVGSVEVTLTETQLRDDLCLGTKTKACILALIKTGRMRSQGLPDGTTTYGFVY